MNRNDLITAVTVALGTATLAIVGFWPDILDAEDGPQPLPPKIAQPTLSVRGIELALIPAQNRTYAAGDEPIYELEAHNTNSGPAEATVQTAMTATSPADALSRVVRTPAVIWQHEQTIVLAPGERKTVALHTGTKLPPNSLISVLLQEAAAAGRPPAPNAIAALSFSTVVAPSRSPGVATL